MMLASVIVPCANVLTKDIVISPQNGIFKHVLTRRSLVRGGESLHHASYGGEKTGLRDHLKTLLLASPYAMHGVPVLRIHILSLFLLHIPLSILPESSCL